MTGHTRRQAFGAKRSTSPGGSTSRRDSRRPARRTLGVIVAATLTVMAVPGVAHGDTVLNTVAASGSPTVAAGETTSIGYSIKNNNTGGGPNGGDTQSGCNPGDATPATLTVIAPAAVTVAPASRPFSSCDTDQFFGFSSSTPGTYSISVSVTD